MVLIFYLFMVYEEIIMALIKGEDMVVERRQYYCLVGWKDKRYQ